MSSTTASVHDSLTRSRDDYEAINGDSEPVPESASERLPLLEGRQPDQKLQSSIVTIFAIWNMMMGTSLLSMPWAYSHAGIVGGLIAILVMGVVCFYTASFMLNIPKSLGLELLEYGDLVNLLLGSVWSRISQLSSISILAGGCIVYWILMNNFALNIANLVYKVGWENESIVTNMSAVVCNNNVQEHLALRFTSAVKFSTAEKTLYTMIPWALVLLQGPLICMRSVSIFLKFNFIGTFSVFFLIAFAIFKAIAWGVINVDLKDHSSPIYVPLFSLEVPVYTGVLALALFIHNCLTTIMKTQANPRNNYRDLAIAYVLVVVTYIVLGVGVYLSFPLDKSCIRDNFLDNLESNDIYAFFARSFLFIQIFTLFPLLCYMVRVQVFSLFSRTLSSSGSSSIFNYETLQIVCHNTVLLFACLMFGFYYPQIGTVIRFCGSFSGMVLTFTLPPAMLVYSKRTLLHKLQWPLAVFLSVIVLLGVSNFVLQFLVHP